MKKLWWLPISTTIGAAAFVVVLGAQAPSHASHSMAADASTPTAPGQAAFGAISEIVRILAADPKTDWSKVNIGALRDHLVDMDEVVMHSVAAQKNVAGGIEVRATGSGNTVKSIQRLVTNHAGMLDASTDYRATVESLPTGAKLTITAKDPNNSNIVARIRGLGFYGLLTEGNHHQPHHLAMARGEMVHRH